MIRKKVGFIIVCISILLFSGCGTTPAGIHADTSGASALAESNENLVQEGSSESGKAETGKSNKSSDNPSDRSSGKAGDEQSAEEESMPVSPVEPLNMEEDDISFVELVGQIGSPISEVRSTLGIDEDSLEKNGVIFGETVKVTLNSSDDQCSSMQLSFLGTPVDSLQIAISEQLGDDGSQVEDGVLWTTSEAFVLLYESAEGCYVDIGLE